MTSLPAAVPIAVLAASLLSGCLVGERGPEGDTDGDLLLDEHETEGWDIDVYPQAASCNDTAATPTPVPRHVNSSAQQIDTDFDGLDDGEEFQWRSDPRSNDTDGDGLSDFEEVQLNLGRRVAVAGALKPFRLDSDRDCLPDGEELIGYVTARWGLQTTDPTDTDTDEDGLSDPKELWVTRTNPRSRDSDGDNATDLSDADPAYDVALNWTFRTLTLKTGSGTQELSFFYSLDLAGGRHLQPQDPPRFNATVGQAAWVTAHASPGLQDVNDGTGLGHLIFQFWLQRSDGTLVLLVPNSTNPIATLTLDPKVPQWTLEGVSGAADGTAAVLETSEARLEFSIATIHLR